MTGKYWDITPSDVYIRVFMEMLEEVDVKLLPEHHLLSYKSLGLEAQYVVTRLFLRTRKWIKESELIKYLPPEKLGPVLTELVEAKWLRDDAQLSDRLDAAGLKELRAVTSQFPVGKKAAASSASRNEIVDALLKVAKQKTFFGPPTAPRLAKALEKETSKLYLLSEKADALTLLSFMYLSPARTTIDTLVRTNMRMMTFPEFAYTPQKDAPIFTSPQAFAQYYAACAVCDQLEELPPTAANVAGVEHILEQIPAGARAALQALEDEPAVTDPRVGPQFTAAYIYGRALSTAATFYGRAGKLDREHELLGQYLEQPVHKSRRGAALVRRLLIELTFYRQLKEKSWLQRALNSYFDAADKINEVDRFDFDRKAVRLMRDLTKEGMAAIELPVLRRQPLPTVEINMDQLPSLSGGRTQWGKAGSAQTVEAITLEYYAERGWTGGHFEGSIISTLYWLSLLDIIYSEKRAFRCRIQSRPLGMGVLLKEHGDEIQRRLDGDLWPVIKGHYETMAERAPMCGVNWDVPFDGLEAIVTGLGTRLNGIIRGMVEGKNSSGFPDLCLWPESESISDDAGHEPSAVDTDVRAVPVPATPAASVPITPTASVPATPADSDVPTETPATTATTTENGSPQTQASPGRVRFVEVKSTNDTLSDSQYVWIEFLLSLGVEVEICKVHKRKRKAQEDHCDN